MWRGVAPLLAGSFTVSAPICAAMGRAAVLPPTPDHAPYAKRAMARDMVAVMERLGFPRFSVAGHDRGGRVAYRLALDHPDRSSGSPCSTSLPTGDGLGARRCPPGAGLLAVVAARAARAAA